MIKLIYKLRRKLYEKRRASSISKEIAKAEKILQSNSSSREDREEAYKIIDNLCSVKMSIDDMEKIDELVQNFLK